MAGGGSRFEYSVERHNRLREENYRFFRWNRRTVRSSVILGIVVPGITFMIFSNQQDRWDWRA
ncbi:hypothetical protein C8J56DRAFT_1168586, partial [Mycena floridula]